MVKPTAAVTGYLLVITHLEAGCIYFGSCYQKFCLDIMAGDTVEEAANLLEAKEAKRERD